MIYKLEISTGEISPVSSEEARRALQASKRWSPWSIDEMFRSTKTLWTATAYFCRYRIYLEDVQRDRATAQLAASLAARGLKLAEVRGW